MDICNEAGTGGGGSRSLRLSLHVRRKVSFPADFSSETTISRLKIRARSVYLLDAESLNILKCLKPGRHQVQGNRHAIAIDSEGWELIRPAEDCVLCCSPAGLSIAPASGATFPAAIGIKKSARGLIDVSPDARSVLRCFSAVCSRPVEQSPYRSHPFFRDDPPVVRVVEGPSGPYDEPAQPAMVWYLPDDLRFLYAIAPLAYYLGAAIRPGETPTVGIRSSTCELPASPRQFERWAGRMLSRTFQMDCAIRHSATVGEPLAGIDVQRILGYSPEELMLMGMPDRFLLYLEALRSPERAFYPWHLASYVDPVPRSAELLPYLLRSLSAVYAPESSPVSERDVVTLSVKAFNDQCAMRSRGSDDGSSEVVLPELQSARDHQWFSGRCPIDATMSSLEALKNGEKFGPPQMEPEVVVICNEDAMMKEARAIKKLLEGVASVEVRRHLGREDLLHAFAEDFDLLHFAGHCDPGGLRCPDGHADLSQVETCNVRAFFLNCCASYRQGARLIEKGSACGIGTMFRVIDEAALDVSLGFYRLLAYGYPVLASYLGARECSVTGKEYLLLGDGSLPVVCSRGAVVPFYRLARKCGQLSLQCDISSPSKGFLIESPGIYAVPDTGFEISDIGPETIPGLKGLPDGMCLYCGRIFPDVASAVDVALAGCRKSLAAPAVVKLGIL